MFNEAYDLVRATNKHTGIRVGSTRRVGLRLQGTLDLALAAGYRGTRVFPGHHRGSVGVPEDSKEKTFAACELLSTASLKLRPAASRPTRRPTSESGPCDFYGKGRLHVSSRSLLQHRDIASYLGHPALTSVPLTGQCSHQSAY